MSCGDITVASSGGCGCSSSSKLLNESGSSGLYSPGVVAMVTVLQMVCYW